ncbi:MAG: cyclase family protein [Planctomycetota bacterium]
MPLIDLTLPVQETPRYQELVTVEVIERALKFSNGAYTGVMYKISHSSMVGTYFDFPGHIKETDDGADSDNYPLDKLVNVKAAVIHLDRESRSGEVGARELAAACPPIADCGAIIINALGHRRFDAIKEHTVWLSLDAGRWIIDQGVHLVVSDIYESRPELTGVFYELFNAKISAVCWPINLHLLTTPYVKLTALPMRLKGVAQLPCRLIAELISHTAPLQ